jgi:hypothetical protein
LILLAHPRRFELLTFAFGELGPPRKSPYLLMVSCVIVLKTPGILPGSANIARTRSVGRIAHIVGMMVTVDALQRLDGHGEEPGRFPLIDTLLHQLCGAGMPQRVRAHTLKTGVTTCGGKPPLEVPEAGTVIIDDETKVGPPQPGAAQVRQQFRRDWDTAAPFVGLRRPWGSEVDSLSLKINLRPAQRQDRLLAATAVEPDQNEQGQVQPHARLAQCSSQE